MCCTLQIQNKCDLCVKHDFPVSFTETHPSVYIYFVAL